MSDIRENLIKWAEWCHENNVKAEVQGVMHEAADEIERLECHLAISKGKHTSAIEEIERLREALGEICSLLSPTTGYWIALKALEDSDE